MNNNAVIFSIVLLALYIGVFSALASIRGISLSAFWYGSLAAIVPWVVSAFAITFASAFLPPKLGQAGGMAGLFPMLIGLAVIFFAPIISLFLKNDIATSVRVKWFGLISTIPSTLIFLFFMYIFIMGIIGSKKS